MNYQTQVKYITFPLLAVKLKEYKKRLTDAIWEKDFMLSKILEHEIFMIETQIALGEKYDIPF